MFSLSEDLFYESAASRRSFALSRAVQMHFLSGFNVDVSELRRPSSLGRQVHGQKTSWSHLSVQGKQDLSWLLGMSMYLFLEYNYFLWKSVLYFSSVFPKLFEL